MNKKKQLLTHTEEEETRKWGTERGKERRNVWV